MGWRCRWKPSRRRDDAAWRAGRWLFCFTLIWALLVGLVEYARGDTPTDVGTGVTSSNPSGQVSGGSWTGDDANGHSTPAVNKFGLRENASTAPASACSDIGVDHFHYLVGRNDGTNGSWTECYELKTGSVAYTGSDGSILARVFYDKDGNATRIELFNQGTGVDTCSASAVGSMAWATATIVAGGLITAGPGTYQCSTANSWTIGKALTLQGADRLSTKISVPTSFNGDVMRLGFTSPANAGVAPKDITIRDLEMDGNKGSATASTLIHVRDAKVSLLNVYLHDWKTGGILMDATISGIVKARVQDSSLFNGDTGTYAFKTSDDQGSCLTDISFFHNEVGGGNLVIDNCANGLQVEGGNHIYGYGQDESGIVMTGSGSTLDARIVGNTIESWGLHGIDNTGADKLVVQGNTFYCNSKGTAGSHDAVSDDIHFVDVDGALVGPNLHRSCGSGAGTIRHGVYISNGNNNDVIGNKLLGSNAASYAVAVSTGGTNRIDATNRCTGTCGGDISDGVLTDEFAAPPLISAPITVITANTTIYAPIGGGDLSTTQTDMQVAMGARRLGRLRAYFSTAPGGTDTVTATLVSGTCGSSMSNTAVTCTATGSAKTCTDMTNVASITQGQCVAWKLDTSATAANLRARMEIQPF